MAFLLMHHQGRWFRGY